MTIIASISKLGNIRSSSSSSSVGSSKSVALSFGNNKSASCACDLGGALAGVGGLVGGVVNAAGDLVTQIPVSLVIDVSANPSISGIASGSCGCN